MVIIIIINGLVCILVVAESHGAGVQRHPVEPAWSTKTSHVAWVTESSHGAWGTEASA